MVLLWQPSRKTCLQYEKDLRRLLSPAAAPYQLCRQCRHNLSAAPVPPANRLEPRLCCYNPHSTKEPHVNRKATNQPNNVRGIYPVRAITSELMALHAHNTAQMMIEAFSGLRAPKPMPPSKESNFYTMGEFVTELPNPNVARISSHFVVPPSFSTDDIVTLMQLHRWCNENGVTQKVFNGAIKENRDNPRNFLITQQGKEFVGTIYEMCDRDFLQRVEKKTSDHPMYFLANSLNRLCVTGTLDEYDGSSPFMASFSFYTGDKNAPFALNTWGVNYLNTYVAIMSGE